MRWLESEREVAEVSISNFASMICLLSSVRLRACTYLPEHASGVIRNGMSYLVTQSSSHTSSVP